MFFSILFASENDLGHTEHSIHRPPTLCEATLRITYVLSPIILIGLYELWSQQCNKEQSSYFCGLLSNAPLELIKGFNIVS